MFQSPPLPRRAVLVALAAAPLALSPALAADVAETFVSQNIQKGMAILNSKLTDQQKRDQFEQFLLGLTDFKRVADFTLGNYRRTASPADLAAFHVAFQNYAMSEYQKNFSDWAGQTLKIVNSTLRAPADYVVATQMIDHSGKPPLDIHFRVRTDTGKPVLTDVALMSQSGGELWVAIAKRDEYVGFLGQHNGNMKMLIAHLSDLAKPSKT